MYTFAKKETIKNATVEHPDYGIPLLTALLHNLLPPITRK